MPVTPNAPVKQGIPKWAIIVFIAMGVFVLFFVLIFFLAFQSNAPVRKVSNELINGVQANDAPAVYSLTSADFKTTATQAEVETILADISPFLQGEEKMTASSISSENGVERAAVVYEIPGPEGIRYFRAILTKDGETWSVVNFRSSETKLEAVYE